MAHAFMANTFTLLLACALYCAPLAFIPGTVFAVATKSEVKSEVKSEAKPQTKISSKETKATIETIKKIETNATLKIEAAPLVEGLLYEAKIPAPAPVDGPDDNSKLIQEAFKTMLVRASGSEKILTHATVVKALTEVDNYVTQFGFQMNANQERVLHVRFDEGLCRTLLTNAGQPVLSGAKRPPVVLWLTMQQDNAIQWVSRETQKELSHQLEALADKRGLSLVYPLLDLTDTALISEQQVWAEDLNALQAASKRYNADNILIGKLSKQPSGWYAQWTYVKQGSSVRWDMSNQELAAVFGEALDEFSNRLSSEPSLVKTDVKQEKIIASGTTGTSGISGFEKNADNKVTATHETSNELHPANTPVAGIAAVATVSTEAASVSTQSKTLRLSISGVSGGEQYAKVLKYLQSLPSVKEVEVAEITPEQTTFKLDTTDSRESLISSIAAGQLLIENNVGNTNTNNTMVKTEGAEALPESSEVALRYKLSEKGPETNP